MTDFSIATRLREIASDTRKLARTRRHKDGKDVTTALEDLAAKLNEIVIELDQPSAGTSAYTMMAESERANLEVSETLINMVAAAVLAKLIADEGGGRANIEFSPKDMDDMHQRYEIDATRDGMITKIKLVPRPGAFAEAGLAVTKHEEIAGMTFSTELSPDADQPEPPESFYSTQDRDEAPAKEQTAEHVYDRPLWATRVDGKIFPASSKEQAERMVKGAKGNQIATIENRFCYHKECPAERCNIAATEVASEN